MARKKQAPKKKAAPRKKPAKAPKRDSLGECYSPDGILWTLIVENDGEVRAEKL